MVKKIRKPLALFLALVMCLGMVNFTALANETADHEHNADGWTCTQAEPVKTLNCEEDHEHGDECYTVTEGEWTCVAPVVEETPAEVTAFLSAVAGIPAITAENAAEVAEYVYGPVSEAYEALLGTEYEERADVQEAVAAYAAAIDAVDAALDMESENYLAQISGKTPTDRFYYNGVEVAQLYEGTYPLSTTYQYSNPATGIEIFVGDPGNYQYLYTKMSTCHCGTVLVEETPDWITVDSNRKLTDSNPGIIQGKPTWNLSGYVAEDWTDYGYEGYPSLQINVVGAKPGNTSIRFQAYQAYDYLYTWQTCNYCRQIYSEVGFNGWIEDTQTLNVMVKARYQLNYDLNGGTGSIASTYDDVADTTATLYVTGEKPADWTKDGKTYTFKGWSETSDGKTPAAGSYTLNWSTGLGGKNNPVQKTLYAIWEEKDEETTYTLIREYWIDGKKIAFVKDSTLKGQVGDEIVGAELAKANPNWANRKDDNVVHTFNYVGCDPTPSLTLTETVADNVITLKYEKNTKPQAPTKEEAAGILDGKYTVKVSCTNEARTHTLASKNYSITAADITSIGAVTKNASGKWEVEVTSTNQKFVDKFEAEANVNCAHDDVSGGFGIKLTWDGSKWTYNETTTKGINTACHPVQPTLYKLKYDANGGTIRSDSNAATTMTHEANSFDNSYTFTVKTAPEASTGFDPTWAGHTLLGWADTAEEANAGTVQYNAGDKIKLTKDAPTKTIYAVWQVNTPVTNPKLEKLEKERLTAAPAGVTLELKGKTVNYDQNVVFVGDNAPAVTLLYKITVTGTEGAKYKVIDNGATWVGGDSLEGTIAEGKTQAVIYVTMDFTKANITADGKLVNNATLKSNDPVTPENPGGTEGPTNGGATGEAGAKKQYNVTINFKTEGGAVLQDPSKTTVDEGADFNYSLESANARKARANSDVTAVVIPQRLGANNEYVLDMVASAAGLKKLAEAKNITADVVADIIYSLDEKGTTGTDSEGKPTDTFDGIPDKYQVKVTFKVVHGKWNDETTADVVKYVVKYAADGVTMDKNGTATLGNIIPAVGGKPDDGFTAGSWDTEPSAETKIKADAAYVYTYAKKTTPIENIKARYLVQWLNEAGEVLKSEIRGPEAIGTVVTVKDEDKAYEGYTFNAENTNNVLEGTLSKTEAVILKLYFTKNPVEHTVTFDSNGGSDVAEQKVKHNELANRPADPTRDGYTFNGWTLNGQPYDFTTPVTGDITLVAQWTQNSRPVDPDPDYTYTLNYNANGGVGAPASQSQINSRNFTVSAVEPTREGYTFAGWATTAGAETAAYQPGSQLRINNGFSLTLFAVWTPEEDVNETEPPLVETPDVTETPDEGEDLGDNDTPLTELPGETEPPVEPTETPDETEDLDEGDTPLAEVPQTGDSIGLWIVLTLCSAAGLYCFFPKKKKGQREI